jgi:DNA invertase Pin-like site-specific DNA recombinase
MTAEPDSRARAPARARMIGYARVSTAEQTTALQVDALRRAGCDEIVEESASGIKTDRAGLAAALAKCERGDVFAVWKLDRMGRSLAHLIATVEMLRKRGVQFKSLTEGIDTTTPGGTLMFNMIGALAQFERDIIRERTVAGLAAARARGRTGGRRRVITDAQVDWAAAELAGGRTQIEVAAELGVQQPALSRRLAAARIEQRRATA